MKLGQWKCLCGCPMLVFRIAIKTHSFQFQGLVSVKIEALKFGKEVRIDANTGDVALHVSAANAHSQ